MKLKLLLACVIFAAGFYSGSVHPFQEAKPAANTYEVYFCPEDACSSQIIRQIDKAQGYIYVAMYSFTQGFYCRRFD